MDARITLAFDEKVIEAAKKFAAENNISLSRLTEFLLTKVTTGNYRALDELPVADWINAVSEGKVDYVRKPRTRKQLKNEYYNSKTK